MQHATQRHAPSLSTPVFDAARLAVATALGALPESIARSALARALGLVARELAADGGDVEAGSFAAQVGSDPALAAMVAAQVEPPRRCLHRHPASVAAAVAEVRQLCREHRPVRILSLGCGYGEEVWSLALALEDAGVAASACRIDAVDASRRAIAAARLGALPRSALRREADRQRCPRVGGEHRVPEHLLATAQFLVADGRDAAAWFDGRRYDVVMFRDVLVGASEAGRAAWFAVLDTVLADDGLLLLGAADGRPAPLGRYVALPLDYAFAWRRRRRAVPPCVLGAEAPRIAGGDALLRPVRVGAGGEALVDTDPLARARRRLARGDVDGAIRIAHRLLAERADDPDALGLLAEAAERQGDPRAAAELRERAARDR